MLLLHIDTAIDKGSFCISKDAAIVAFEINLNRNEQAGWLHVAIDSAFRTTGIDPKELDAIAVSNGPGSYTGLRIGLASAKGFCYALDKPLICINTLQIMAGAVRDAAAGLICPMIDARRMEVFTAVYNKELVLQQQPFAEVLTAESFAGILQNGPVLFTGNGSKKFAALVKETPNAQFIDKETDARDMVPLAVKAFRNKDFSDVAYCEPFYTKDVYISTK